MNEAISVNQKKTHKYSIVGFIIGGLLILSALTNLLIPLRTPELKFDPLIVLPGLVAGVLLVIRSLHPPIGLVRGLAILFGGIWIGIIPMVLANSASQQQLAPNLVMAGLGALLLWFGFTKQKKKNKSVEPPATITQLTEDGATEEEKSEKEQQDGGFWGAEKKGIKKGVSGGLVMIAIAVIWFIAGVSAGYIFYYPPILFCIGVYALIKGLVTRNMAGKNKVSEVETDRT